MNDGDGDMTDDDIIGLIDDDGESLTRWEIDFVESMATKLFRGLPITGSSHRKPARRRLHSLTQASGSRLALFRLALGRFLCLFHPLVQQAPAGSQPACSQVWSGEKRSPKSPQSSCSETN